MTAENRPYDKPAPAPGHAHEWAPPRRATTGGWYTECKSCTAWWADPSPMLPVAVPASMTTVPDDVVYPPAVPSNTADARPPYEVRDAPDLPLPVERDRASSCLHRVAMIHDQCLTYLKVNGDNAGNVGCHRPAGHRGLHCFAWWTE